MAMAESSLTACTGSSPFTGLVATAPRRAAASTAFHSASARSTRSTAKKCRCGPDASGVSIITPITQPWGFRVGIGVGVLMERTMARPVRSGKRGSGLAHRPDRS